MRSDVLPITWYMLCQHLHFGGFQLAGEVSTYASRASRSQADSFRKESSRIGRQSIPGSAHCDPGSTAGPSGPEAAFGLAEDSGRFQRDATAWAGVPWEETRRGFRSSSAAAGPSAACYRIPTFFSDRAVRLAMIKHLSQ